MKLRDIPDEMFSSEMMGPGLAIILDMSDFSIYSPIDSETSAIYPTGHAVALSLGKEHELLLHVGLESFRNKDLINKFIINNQKVELFQKILEINSDKMGPSDNIIIITIPNLKPNRIEYIDEIKVQAKKSIIMRINIDV